MFKILSHRQIRRMLKEAYEAGIGKGYELGWMMKQVENTNRGFIVGSRVDQEVEEILRKKGAK